MSTAGRSDSAYNPAKRTWDGDDGRRSRVPGGGRARFLAELGDFLRIPSISSASAHRADVRRCAEFAADHLRRIGFAGPRCCPPSLTATRWSTPSGWARREAPTALVYGHYDVQPVDPIELWHTPPFEPTVRDDLLFARGAVDDKGQVYMHFAAAEAFLATRGRLPLNLKVLLEGEEEIGSANLDAFVADHRDLLAADVGVISDTPMYDADHPSLCYGLRGLTYLQVEVEGPSGDLHSGSWGGIVANPALALAGILAQLKEPERPRDGARLLRRGAAAGRRRAGGHSPPCPSTPRAWPPSSACPRSSARPSTRRWSGSGRAPRSRSTASGAASAARARRRSSPRAPAPS